MQYQTLMRPYAQAAFDSATDKGKLDQWIASLSVLSEVLSSKEFQVLFEHPAFTPKAVADLMADVLNELKIEDQDFIRFIEVLAHYRRLALLPELLEELQVLVNRAQNQMPITIESAFELSEQASHKLLTWLEQKYQKHIQPHFIVNQDLIGGALIHAGDQVIDMSVRGQLQRLKSQLTH